MKKSSGTNLLPGISEIIQRTNIALEKAASNDRPVFITGELGTEKAFAAKLIHQLSARMPHPFTKVNVSWKLPPDLSQYFEQCAGGSLIIHLQKEFPIDMQYTLVEMASDKSFADPMTGDVIEADVRIILMTSLDLETLARRTPLLPELNELLINQHIEIPPLRDRLEDIPALVRYALKRAYETGKTTATAVDPQVLALFRRWDWPGNAEDLLLVTAQAAIKAKGPVATIDDLPGSFMRQLDEDLIKAARTVRTPASVTNISREEVTGESQPEPIEESPVESDLLPQDEVEGRPLSRTELERMAETQKVLADPETDPEGLEEFSVEEEQVAPEVPQFQQDEQVASPEHPVDPLNSRVLNLARRLHAQSILLKRQMTGPLEQSELSLSLEELARDADERDALLALESELDRGLETVHALRRQLALLNIRQQQSAETIRDVIQRLNLMSQDLADEVDREEMMREARELVESLGKVDEIIQRVSTEIPAFGKHLQTILTTGELEEFGDDDPTRL